jgi:hypothetical protein
MKFWALSPAPAEFQIDVDDADQKFELFWRLCQGERVGIVS